MTRAGDAPTKMKPRVRISLITSVLNGEPYIAQMLSSIPAGLPIEHLVIDAGSTDGTLARVQMTPGIRLLSRPGMPLYAAWNLALEQAAGEAVWFVNADDILPPGAVEAVLDALDRHRDAEIIQGRAEAFAEDTAARAGPASLRYPAPGAALDPLDLIFGAPVINARIYRRCLIDRAGPFDTGYRYAADRDWLLRLAFGNAPPTCVGIDALLYRYRMHGGSMTLSQDPKRRLAIAEEQRSIADRRWRATSCPGADRDLLAAWGARETLVGAAAALRTGNVAAAAWHVARLAAGLPLSAGAVARARRYRREYISRLDACPAKPD